KDFIEQPGRGIRGVVQGWVVCLGTPAWLAAQAEIQPSIINSDFPATASSSVHLSIDGQYRGAFSLANELRPGIERLIRGLASDCEIALLSGDNERERERFRALFGEGAALHFNQSPHDKLDFIRRLQSSGKTVMMVGDGLNDAGALRQSDVGVAVVEKVGAFSAASDIIIEAEQVRHLTDVIALARHSVRVVRAGLWISSAYNLVGVSIAAAGLLSPLVCSILMPLSSVSVVLFGCG